MEVLAAKAATVVAHLRHPPVHAIQVVVAVDSVLVVEAAVVAVAVTV